MRQTKRIRSALTWPGYRGKNVSTTTMKNAGSGRSIEASRRLVLGLTLPIVLLVVWQLIGQSPGMAGVVPTPVQVAYAWKDWIFADAGMGLNPYLGTWGSNVQYSSMRVAQGFALAVVLGVPLGLIIGWSRLVAQMVDPMVQGLRPIPITAWLPFSIA